MISQSQKMKMQQKLTPQQLLLMRLLQLPVTQMEQRIKEEVEKNPLLEMEEGPAEIHDHPEEMDNDDEGDFRGMDIDDYFDDDYSYRERLEKDHNREEHRMETSDSTSFVESLLQQLSLHNLSDRERTLCVEIVGSIDGSGYLGRDLELIANDLAFRNGMEFSIEDMEKALAEVQSLDPAGVGARSLQECLLLQLKRSSEDSKSIQLATKIVEKYFDALSNKHYNLLMTQMKISHQQLDDAIEVIRHLNPKPGWGRDEHKGAQYIIPDFIVAREGERLSFSLGESITPRLRLNSEYTELMQQLSTQSHKSSADKETIQFIKSKSEAATGFMELLQQRQQTLANTMDAILKMQRTYFLTGNSSDLRPMKLKDIASATGYDESTISRVVNEKYVQTDFGTFLLKELFTKAVQTDQGDMMATTHIKEVLRKTIESEDKVEPLTDEALAKLLQEKGFRLSRRTVTKYRESMGIPVGRLRKEIRK